jgi:hypothetical protein
MKQEDLGKTLKQKITEILQVQPDIKPKRIAGILEAEGWKANLATVRMYSSILRK